MYVGLLCVRLTNWDAHDLAKMVSKGMAVDFKETASGAPRHRAGT